jgi:hypothetical protein
VRTPDRKRPEPKTTQPTARPFDPHAGPSEEDILELREPYDLATPEYPDRWLPGLVGRRPEYFVVVDQRRPRQPGQPPSLNELLESINARTRESEPDLEAEP